MLWRNVTMLCLVLIIAALALAPSCRITIYSPELEIEGPVSMSWSAFREAGARGRITAEAMALDISGNVYIAGSSVVWGSDGSREYATVKYDNNGNELWVARYDGPVNGDDDASAIAVDASGNVYVTGTSYGGGTPQQEEGDCDYATVKYDSNGNELWVKRYDGPNGSYHYPPAIALDGSGNVYVAGYATVTGGYREGDRDYATIKYSSDGTELWVRLYGESVGSRDMATAIAVDGSGDVYVTGSSAGDCVTIKYGSNGNRQWVARYDGPAGQGDGGNAIVVDGSGSIYITGHSVGIDTRGDYLTIKYNSYGKQLWVGRYDGPTSMSDSGQAIAVDDLGNVHVTGQSHGNDNDEDNWYREYATVKYDSDGNELWVARYVFPRLLTDGAEAIAIDKFGGVYVAGEGFATLKYDSGGNQIWVAQYTGPSGTRDRARAIALDDMGNVYIAGSLLCKKTTVPGPGCEAISERDHEGSAIIKYSQ